jgi:hypothetical protein
LAKKLQRAILVGSRKIEAGRVATFIDNGTRGSQDGPAFRLLSNLVRYFEIGVPYGQDVWLEGKIVDGEFVFNGRLFLHDGTFGTLIDNFPKGPLPHGWRQQRSLDNGGIELIDSRGETIFAYRVDGDICSVEVNLYAADGTLAATKGQGGLVINIDQFQLGENTTPSTKMSADELRAALHALQGRDGPEAEVMIPIYVDQLMRRNMNA